MCFQKKKELRKRSRFSRLLFYTIGNFISYRIKKDAPLRMRTRAKSRVLPDGNRARRECAPRPHLFIPFYPKL